VSFLRNRDFQICGRKIPPPPILCSPNVYYLLKQKPATCILSQMNPFDALYFLLHFKMTLQFSECCDTPYVHCQRWPSVGPYLYPDEPVSHYILSVTILVLFYHLSTSNTAFFCYTDWGFSVLFPQLWGKCQGKNRKHGARPAFFQISCYLCCSVYCLSNDYGLDGPGFESRWGEVFRCPDWPWGPRSLLYNGYRVFPGCKVRLGRAVDHSPPSNAVVKKG
jgi:hypothetical protein